MPLASTSLAAYHSLHSAPIRDKITALIEASGSSGLIKDEVCELLPELAGANGTITSRFSELERGGLIFRAGDTRPGASGRAQKVMRSIRYSATTPSVPLKKPKKNPFLEGMIFAAKTIVKQSDLSNAKHVLGIEIRKVMAR